MSKTITKTIQTIVALNEVAWYDQHKEDYAVLSNMARFNLKRNMKALREIANSFYEVRDEENGKIREEFFNEEKSVEQMVKNDQGEEVQGRVIKDEYMEDLQKAEAEAQARLNEILADTEEVSLYVINIEDEIEKADEKGVEISDATMDMLSLFDEGDA